MRAIGPVEIAEHFALQYSANNSYYSLRYTAPEYHGAQRAHIHGRRPVPRPSHWLTRVRLFEGELALQVANDPRPLLLRTGEGALHRHGGRFNGGWQSVSALDHNVGAWVDGMLVASQMRLADFRVVSAG